MIIGVVCCLFNVLYLNCSVSQAGEVSDGGSNPGSISSSSNVKPFSLVTTASGDAEADAVADAKRTVNPLHCFIYIYT